MQTAQLGLEEYFRTANGTQQRPERNLVFALTDQKPA